MSFGLTSGVVTTLGVILGLYASTESTLAVVSAIATIALVDSFSDALGIHTAEESEGVHSDKEIWVSTITTFLSKLIFTLSFMVPVLIFNLNLSDNYQRYLGFVFIGNF